jgi:hypothetical protein
MRELRNILPTKARSGPGLDWHYILLISNMSISGKKTILGFIGLLVLAIAAWQLYKYRLIRNKVEKAVAEKTKGLYDIHYEDISLDEASGALHVKNITITPDTTVYRRMTAERKDPSVLIKAVIPALDIAGVKTPKALLTRQIEGRSITIANPSIEIMVNDSHKDSTVHDPSKDISRELLGKLLKIGMDSVKILHGSILVKKIDAKEPIVGTNDLTCLLSGLLIDSLSVKDTSRIFYSRSLDMACDEIQLPSKNKKYRIHIARVAFNSREDELFVGRLRVIPQLSEIAFAASYPVSKDRYDFSLENIRLVHLDRRSLWHKQIEADSLVIGESAFSIYRDLSYPHDTISKVGKYPQQQLMRLPVPINFRKVFFKHSFIEYKEKNARSDSAGKLQFYDVTAAISNVTNRRVVIARDDRCMLRFHAKLLNQAPVDARLVMLLRDPKGRFSIVGDVGPIDAPMLNPLIRPMGLANMDKGHVDGLHFTFKGDDSSCKGRLTMLYQDVKISLLKKDKKEGKLGKKGVASLLANIIMKDSNPGKGDDPRTVEVHFKRILNKSFFNLLWKSIFTGVKETVGIK